MGIVIYKLLTGRSPLYINPHLDIFANRDMWFDALKKTGGLEDRLSAHGKKASAKLLVLMKGLLCNNPAQRLTAVDALLTEFFN